MSRLQIIADSDYGYWRDFLKLPTTQEQDAACLFLEGKGYRFLVDYGYENAIAKASVLGGHFTVVGST